MTTRPNPVNRTSTSKISGPPVDLHPSALLSSSASVTGSYPISLAANAIIQPRSNLSSAVGPIEIGEGSIISERASVGVSKQTPTAQTDAKQNSVSRVALAQGVLIECGAVVEAESIGAFTAIEAGARIGKGAVIGKSCKICARVQIGEGDVVGDDMVVFGSGWGERRVEKRGGVMDGKREAWVKAQGEVLKKAWTGK